MHSFSLKAKDVDEEARDMTYKVIKKYNLHRTKQNNDQNGKTFFEKRAQLQVGKAGPSHSLSKHSYWKAHAFIPCTILARQNILFAAVSDALPTDKMAPSRSTRGGSHSAFAGRRWAFKHLRSFALGASCGPIPYHGSLSWQMNFRFFHNELSMPKSMHNFRVWRRWLWNNVSCTPNRHFFFVFRAQGFLHCAFNTSHDRKMSLQQSAPDGKLPHNKYWRWSFQQKLSTGCIWIRWWGGDVFRFQGHRVWNASTKVDSCWPIKQHPSDKKTFLSIDNRVNNDSCGWFHKIGSTTLEWWQLPIAHCCFMSTFLRFRSAHQSTQWQKNVQFAGNMHAFWFSVVHTTHPWNDGLECGNQLAA